MKPRTNKLGSKNIIGKQVTRHRQLKGISQKELVAKLQTMGVDINPSSFSKLEGQTRQVSDRELFYIAQALDIQLMELFPDKRTL